MTDHWLILGTGKHAREHFPKVDADFTITANGGLDICPDADFYWISDPAAVEIFRSLWEPYKGQIISNEKLGRETIPFPYLDKGVLFHGRTSGTLMAHVAICMGATRLTFVGHEGYPETAPVRRRDGTVRRLLGPEGAKALNLAMSNALQALADAYPPMEVTIYSPDHLKVPRGWQIGS